MIGVVKDTKQFTELFRLVSPSFIVQEKNMSTQKNKALRSFFLVPKANV